MGPSARRKHAAMSSALAASAVKLHRSRRAWVCATARPDAKTRASSAPRTSVTALRASRSGVRSGSARHVISLKVILVRRGHAAARDCPSRVGSCFAPRRTSSSEPRRRTCRFLLQHPGERRLEVRRVFSVGVGWESRLDPRRGSSLVGRSAARRWVRVRGLLGVRRDFRYGEARDFCLGAPRDFVGLVRRAFSLRVACDRRQRGFVCMARLRVRVIFASACPGHTGRSGVRAWRPLVERAAPQARRRAFVLRHDLRFSSRASVSGAHRDA